MRMIKVKFIKEKQGVLRFVIKSIREDYGISQVELARRLGVTQSYISKLERGTRGIAIYELMEYCQAMNVSLTEFSARYEWHLGLKLPSEKPHMKRCHEILQSFNLTRLHKVGEKERKEE